MSEAKSRKKDAQYVSAQDRPQPRAGPSGGGEKGDGVLLRAFTRPTRLLALLGLVFAGFLYWKPIGSYLHTKRVLQQRHAEVERLQTQNASLKTRIAEAGTGDALIREARRLGLVKPGERLFIVRGIQAWRANHHQGN